ncbi:hypothetical protein [Anaerosinus massiliensis]|uniref:hypothetical protein n=1 Tax=Massilibacillus massiliensis TaxID=1806837 RepID=UPI000DA620DE|nr:hypothetical protein [Massilibacillus massiliensis]
MKQLQEKIKNMQFFLQNHGLNTRVVWLGVIGIVLLIFGSIFDGNMLSSKTLPNSEAKNDVNVEMDTNNKNSYEKNLEYKLTQLLSRTKGAGNVAVSITLEGSARQEHEKNIVKETKTVQEKDTSGGVRTTTEIKENQQILVNKENGVDKPVVLREINPTIKGVLVIADGAADSIVKANLTKAVETSLGISSYKITVLPQRK